MYRFGPTIVEKTFSAYVGVGCTSLLNQHATIVGFFLPMITEKTHDRGKKQAYAWTRARKCVRAYTRERDPDGPHTPVRPRTLCKGPRTA